MPPLPDVHYVYQSPQIELRSTTWGLIGLVKILPGPGQLSPAQKGALAEAKTLHITIRAGPDAFGKAPLPADFDRDSLEWALRSAPIVEPCDPPTSAFSQLAQEVLAFSLGPTLEIECPPETRDTWIDFAWRNHFVRVGAACSAQAVPMWIWPEYLPSA
uniref:Non-ribosomal peptide synthetase n=1 Tax=Xanthobacter autotrophicus TaxID=280 RepID=A0A168S4P1_XANAU|nr:non-ribosomal peptide synthetase [Xanthobacter autotrophicus]